MFNSTIQIETSIYFNVFQKFAIVCIHLYTIYSTFYTNFTGVCLRGEIESIFRQNSTLGK